MHGPQAAAHPAYLPLASDMGITPGVWPHEVASTAAPPGWPYFGEGMRAGSGTGNEDGAPHAGLGALWAHARNIHTCGTYRGGPPRRLVPGTPLAARQQHTQRTPLVLPPQTRQDAYGQRRCCVAAALCNAVVECAHAANDALCGEGVATEGQSVSMDAITHTPVGQLRSVSRTVNAQACTVRFHTTQLGVGQCRRAGNAFGVRCTNRTGNGPASVWATTQWAWQGSPNRQQLQLPPRRLAGCCSPLPGRWRAYSGIGRRPRRAPEYERNARFFVRARARNICNWRAEAQADIGTSHPRHRPQRPQAHGSCGAELPPTCPWRSPWTTRPGCQR